MIKSDVAPATFISYGGVVRLHLVPALGELRLSKLGAQHVQRFKEEMSQAIVTVGPRVEKLVEGEPAPAPRHLSSATVKYCLFVLRMALDHACRLDHVPRNVALLVDFPKAEQAEIEPFLTRAGD